MTDTTQQPNDAAAILEHMAATIQEDEPQAGEYQQAPENKPEPTGPTTAEIVSSVLYIGFNKLIAPKRGEHWELSAKEAEAAGEAYGACIDKWWPDLQAGPEVAALIITLSIFGPRMAADAQVRKQRAADAAKEADKEAAQ